MSVHYKFKSALDYDTVTFDGLHISVGDLKSAISQQKRIGKTSDFDLQITNAQTKEVYVDDHTLIPKNTSLLVARVPLSQQPKKQWEGSNNQATHPKDVAPNKGLADLSRMEGSEQDKINAMISQSTVDYDPSNYQKIRGQNQRGAVPANYICYKCQKRGHWIKDCPLANSADSLEIRRSTGIPRSFMVPVEGPKAPGAMMTPRGTFAVPAVDHEAYLASESGGGGDAPSNVPTVPDTNIPDELICSLCRDLLTDAVMIPCCGNSFCDECIRGALLESEDHECPDCREKEISPTTLIPNRFLRNSVSSFRNQTGYNRRMPHRQPAVPIQQHPPVIEGHPPGQVPANGPVQPGPNDADKSGGNIRGAPPPGEESDGSADDNITVTLPGAHRAIKPPHPFDVDRRRHPRYDTRPPGLKPPGIETPPNMPMNMPRIDEQRASTPTIDERRDPMSMQMPFTRGLPPPFAPGVPPPSRPYNSVPFNRGMGPGPLRPPYNDQFRREPFQPPPPGIKDSPTNGHGDDPLEAFNRMIREKEMRAKRREEERRRVTSGSRSPRSRTPRSPRDARSSRSRSPRLQRSPRPPRSPRSPRPTRSPRSPRLRPRSRGSSRLRYSRSRSPSRGRMRRSPWSPRFRRSRDRSLSLTRSPSPRRRHRSPMRYRSPLRSPPRSPLRSPPRSPPRSLPRSPPRSPPRDPIRSPHRPVMRSPPPRNISPHRYAGVYDELLSPPRRNVEPPYGARYGPRGGTQPAVYPPLGGKPIPPLGSLPLQTEPPPGFRGRYDGPPFEDIPPGVEPPVPGFEPSPFEKPPIGPPGLIDRDRLPPSNFRDPYRPPPRHDGPGGYRDMPIPPLIPTEIPVHVGEQPPRFRENYRPGHYRDQGPPGQFRDGQPYREVPQGAPYRDPNFRGGPPTYRDSGYRNMPYRDGAFRENLPHVRFPETGVPYRPPSADPREPIPPNNYHDANFRDNYRDENGARDHTRPGFRSNIRNRSGPRRNPNGEHDRHRDRDPRDRERYNESREIMEKSDRNRDPDRRAMYDKTRDPREGRDDRPREYEKSREYDKERDVASPDKKSRISPKRSRETREKKRSESRGRSRERESRRDKKEERTREKSADRSRDHKDKDKKLKERKKKKREKDKDSEKKKKREKKDKKEKDHNKKETDNEDKEDAQNNETDSNVAENDKTTEVKTEKKQSEEIEVKAEAQVARDETEDKPMVDLYGDDAAGAVDKEIIENYVKTEEKNTSASSDTKNVENTSKDELFDGIELQVTADELDLKAEIEGSNQPNKEMLATLPALSKWEVDEDNAEKIREPGEITSPDEEEDGGKVTSDVIKRAENAIFAKAINSLRPIEIKKISSDRLKLYGDEVPKAPMNNIQITVPVTDSEQRSIEINEKKRRYSKTPPPRLSVKERLGGKVEEIRRGREPRVVHSTVERVKSRSKTPKRDQPYRRVTVEIERGRKNDNINEMIINKARHESSKGDRRIMSETLKINEKHRGRRSPSEKKHADKTIKEEKKNESNALRERADYKNSSDTKNENANRERKKSTLDEAHFEPDYDETVESDNETKQDVSKKRDLSTSPTREGENKKAKIDSETIKLDLTNVKKKPESESESTSDSEYSSSSSSSDARKRKKKKKRSKKKKKRAVSESESESESSSDDHKKKKKKRKHKKKSSKKKKKSKHK